MFYLNNEISTQDKYAIEKFANHDGESLDILTSSIIERISELKSIGLYIVDKEEHRPDLLSYNLYKDTQYWFLLLLYNDIHDYRELKQGQTVKYFSIVELEALYFDLKRQSKNNQVSRD
ncbi:Base plate wedge protein 53 [Thiovulum sp. ES]|nr:Base plate wedge protein 53 [Thiovulum sp. ES]